MSHRLLWLPATNEVFSATISNRGNPFHDIGNIYIPEEGPIHNLTISNTTIRGGHKKTRNVKQISHHENVN